MTPFEGFIKHIIKFIRVDLPEPVLPFIPTVSPRLILRLQSFTINELFEG